MTTLQNETVAVREISHDSYCVDNYWSQESFDNGRHEIEESDESWHVVSRKKNNSKFNQAQKRRNCQQRSLNKESNTSEAISANNTLTSSDLSSLRNKAKKGTKEKLPDRKLYSVREKQNKEKEKKEIVKEITGTNGLEDDKSYTSTGSTTFSERHKPTDEEINLSREEKKERTAFHEIDSPQPETSETPMFSICLERQGVCETIPIYEVNSI